MIALVPALDPRREIDPRRVFAALATLLIHPGADPEIVRLRLLAEQARNRSDLTREQRADIYAAAQPPPPELYWHGRDGLACPCESCCQGSLRTMSGLLDERQAHAAEAKPPVRNRHRTPGRRAEG